MKKILACLLFMFLTAALLAKAAPEAAAYEPGDPYSPDLSELIRDADHRTYVETLTDSYMRTNTSVWKALRKGQCAMFLFEGCSDNLNDRRLADLSFYRVSAVCLVVRLISRGSRISSISTRIAAPFRIARWNSARGSWKMWGRSAPQRFGTEPMNCIP